MFSEKKCFCLLKSENRRHSGLNGENNLVGCAGRTSVWGAQLLHHFQISINFFLQKRFSFNKLYLTVFFLKMTQIHCQTVLEEKKTKLRCIRASISWTSYSLFAASLLTLFVSTFLPRQTLLLYQPSSHTSDTHTLKHSHSHAHTQRAHTHTHIVAIRSEFLFLRHKFFDDTALANQKLKILKTKKISKWTDDD